MSLVGRHDCDALVISTEKRNHIPDIYLMCIFSDEMSPAGRHDCDALVISTEKRNHIPV